MEMRSLGDVIIPMSIIIFITSQKGVHEPKMVLIGKNSQSDPEGFKHWAVRVQYANKQSRT